MQFNAIYALKGFLPNIEAFCRINIAIALEIKKASLASLDRVSVGKDFFNRDELHVVRSMLRGGKQIFCNCGRFRFTAGVI